ncbi:MAG: alpha amylase C-terminal domain-containing protein, partial [Beijerinckiaceae bacterium]
YRIGLPHAGRWREIINTDALDYGGSGQGNGGQVIATDWPSHGFPASADVLVPPLATLHLQWEPD